MEELSGKEKIISRRKIILGGGLLAAGAVALGGVSGPGIGLLPQAEAKETPLPWPYEKIDPNEVAKIAYEDFYKARCSYAVARSIMVPLQKIVGEPYISQPLYEGLKLGEGGIAGWGTVCGALLGATIMTGFLTPTDTGKKILNELFTWYSDSPLPAYKPEKPRTQISIQTTSKSPLCHISVGKWCKKAGKALKTPEQEERCARLTADVAMRTVMLLNEWKDGKFNSTRKLPLALYGITSQSNCTECHGTKVPAAVK